MTHCTREAGTACDKGKTPWECATQNQVCTQVQVHKQGQIQVHKLLQVHKEVQERKYIQVHRQVTHCTGLGRGCVTRERHPGKWICSASAVCCNPKSFHVIIMIKSRSRRATLSLASAIHQPLQQCCFASYISSLAPSGVTGENKKRI